MLRIWLPYVLASIGCRYRDRAAPVGFDTGRVQLQLCGGVPTLVARWAASTNRSVVAFSKELPATVELQQSSSGRKVRQHLAFESFGGVSLGVAELIESRPASHISTRRSQNDHVGLAFLDKLSPPIPLSWVQKTKAIHTIDD